VPVAHNAGYYWPRRGGLKKPGVIRVVIGPPIEAAGRDPRELNEEVRSWIEHQIAAIAPAAAGNQAKAPIDSKEKVAD
jgi:1-acyl-sn-glycerol-3-phosphate acyltransferase